MRGFVAGEVDILVSTMIVESGLDVPNANTMVVHDAHRFGLAQLYQLRGPRGTEPPPGLLLPAGARHDRRRRGGAAARCWSTTPISGAGYRIALKDLELRGAGNLLGAEQSGHAQAVGFDLYMRWLEETVQALRGQGRREQPAPPDVVLDRPAHLPDAYVPDDDVKLDLYRRLARAGRRPATLMGCATNCASASARCRSRPRRCSTWRGSASWARCSASSTCWCGATRRGSPSVPGRSPRLAGLTSALDDVQLAAEVRRTVPLSLRLAAAGRRADRARTGAGAAKASAVDSTPAHWRCHATQRDPRWLVPRALAALVGCGNFRDLFSAHADVAAEAAGQQLPSAAARADPELGREGRQGSTGRPPTTSPTSGWTTRCSAQAVAENKLPTDSASIAEAMWPEHLRAQGHPLARHA